MARISLAIAARGPCDARRMWERLAGWTELDAHLAYDDDTVLVEKPDWVSAHRHHGGSVFDLWGKAIAQCSGDYIAILSPYVVPGDRWLEAMMVASTSGQRAYFGPVEHDYEHGDAAIIGYIVEYGHFHRPLRRDHGEIPGTNLIVRSDEFPSRADLSIGGFTKTALLAAWNEQGYKPDYVDEAVALHYRPFDALSYRDRRYRHGRAYGAAHRRALGIAGTIAASAKTVLLPLVRVWRIWSRARHMPRLRVEVRQNFWTILRAETAWSAGEFLGLITGQRGDQKLLD